MNYRKDVEIDKLDLDNEIATTPALSSDYWNLYSNKKKEKDDLELELEVEEAKIDKRIRDSYEKKPSEAQIKNMIIMDSKRVELVKKVNALTEEVNILRGAISSFDKKSKALTDLVDLYKSDYYSTSYRKKSRRRLNDS